MTTHYPTVPVDGALRAAHLSDSNRIRPLALVADDDPMITATLAAILNVSGLATLTAQDGLGALEIATLIPPEILITDLVLPGLSGFDLAARVTRNAPDCDVIVFVGSTAPPGVSAAMATLRCNFKILLKPVHPADLLQAVFALLVPHGNILTPPTEVRVRSPYDLLTTARPEHGSVPVGVTLTRRQRCADSLGH